MRNERKQRLLFGFKSVPYPLRADGVSVRYLPILEHLGSRHEVDLLVVDGRAEKARLLDGLRPYCREVVHLRHPRRQSHAILTKCRTYLKYLAPNGPPLSVVAHRGATLTREIVEAVRGKQYDAAVWVGGELLPNFVEALPSLSVGKVYVDFIDSPYLWVCRRKEGVFRIGLLDRYERWKTLRWERGMIQRFDGTIYISHVDAEAVPGVRASGTKRHVVPNGINVPPSGVEERFPLPTPNIGFLGTMGYQPNIEAVEWLHKEIFLPLRERIPELTLVVIGRYPAPSIRKLGDTPGVIVTGEVDDIWKYVRGIDVFVFPLLRGAGLKNKILETMYAGRPVLTTQIGNEGIDAVSGESILLGDTAEEFRRETIRLLGAPAERARLGKAAHLFVKDRFCWEAILRGYEEIVLSDARGPGREGGALMSEGPVT